MGTRGGIGRVVEKLEASINSGKYYEAHQMYRTLYFRLLNQKKYTDLLNMLNKGSMLLLEHDQQGSGADLAILLIEVLNKSDIDTCEEWIEKLSKLFELMSSSIPEREQFLTNSVKWSMNNNKRGHPLLHQRIAEVYWREKNYTAAHKHFLHSSNGDAYANMLIEIHMTRGLKSEVDLFIAQAVFQFLCLRNIEMASETFDKYTAKHPKIKNDKGPPYILPLLNFLWFLMRAVEQKTPKQFTVLRSSYAISLKRDPNYSVYLDKIGRIWFGIELKSHNRNRSSMLGGLLKSIIGDVESSDDEGEYNVTSTLELD